MLGPINGDRQVMRKNDIDVVIGKAGSHAQSIRSLSNRKVQFGRVKPL